MRSTTSGSDRRQRTTSLRATLSLAVLFATSCAATSLAVDPPAANTQLVIAEGVGTTAAEALNDAFRAAVRQVVGALVDGDTLVKSDKIISDKVLTASKDIIMGRYKELSRSQDKGLWRLKIAATVGPRDVVLRLRDANVSVKGVEGKDLAVEVLTQKEAREKATELMETALKELPNVLAAEIRKPAAKDYDVDARTLRLDLSVKADAKKLEAFNKRFFELMDKVSLSKDRATLRAANPQGTVFTAQTGRFAFLEAPEGKKGWYLFAFDGMDGQAVVTRWKVYFVDSDLKKLQPTLLAQPHIRITLLDAEGKVITEEMVNLNQRKEKENNGMNWLIASPGFRPKGTINLGLARMPMSFLGNGGAPGGEFYYRPNVTYSVSVKLTEEELKRLKDIKCSIMMQPPDEAVLRLDPLRLEPRTGQK